MIRFPARVPPEIAWEIHANDVITTNWPRKGENSYAPVRLLSSRAYSLLCLPLCFALYTVFNMIYFATHGISKSNSIHPLCRRNNADHSGELETLIPLKILTLRLF